MLLFECRPAVEYERGLAVRREPRKGASLSDGSRCLTVCREILSEESSAVRKEQESLAV